MIDPTAPVLRARVQELVQLGQCARDSDARVQMTTKSQRMALAAFMQSDGHVHRYGKVVCDVQHSDSAP
jgi:hypothetical protein